MVVLYKLARLRSRQFRSGSIELTTGIGSLYNNDGHLPYRVFWLQGSDRSLLRPHAGPLVNLHLYAILGQPGPMLIYVTKAYQCQGQSRRLVPYHARGTVK